MLFLNLLSFEMHVLSRALGGRHDELSASLLWLRLSCPGGWNGRLCSAVGALTP